MAILRSKLLIVSFCVASFSGFSYVHAQSALGTLTDCSDVSVNFTDNPDLTREEKLQLMDQALFQSLNKFDLCQDEKNKQSASNGGGGGAGAQGSDGGSGDAQTNSPVKSVASSGMSGTEAPSAPPSAPDISNSEEQPSWATSDEELANSSQDVELPQSTGKLPDDIPAAANDDALAAQIRYAAENETDPQKKAQLWDEYRKYKGLPTKG